MNIRLVACLLALVAIVPACGRRGPLEDPGTPRVIAPAGSTLSSGIGTGAQSVDPTPLATRTIADPTPKSPQDNLLDTQSAGAQVAPDHDSAGEPKRRFLLDPLL